MVGEEGIAGVALVEFTILAPMLVVMSIYTIDFGLLFYGKIQVQNAAQAGVNWAIANRRFNSSDISSVVAINNTNSPAISRTAIIVSSGYPLLRCGCPSSTGVTFTTYSGATCPACGSLEGGVYVTVQTQATYNPFVGYGLFPAASTLTAQSTARIQ
jgi:Flp pilus assembly protein TadG